MESLELDPNQPMTYNNLGKLTKFMKFIRTYVYLLLSHGFTASLYGESERYQESERMFKKSIAMNPNYVEAYFNLG